MQARLRVVVSLGLIAGLLLSPKLWLSSRNFPLTPVLPIFPPIPPPFDYVVFGALMVLLLTIAVWPASRLIVAAVLIALFYAMFDQQRWQPWFYQYLVMLIAIGSANTCRLLVASIYIWSGIQKFNPGFQHETFPWILQPLIPSALAPGLQMLAFGAPVIESAIGIGLLTRRFRNAAVIAAVSMHMFILASIGPFGHNHNRVVWPWNLAMCAFVYLLFWRTPGFAARDAFRSNALVLVLFGIMPVFSFYGWWDSYASFSLYSGNQNKATIYMADSVAGKLPDEVQEVIGVHESGIDTLDIEDWSYDELNVPPYAEIRVLRAVGRRVCANTGNSSLMVLVIRERNLWFHPRRMLSFTCGMLKR